MCVRGFDPTNTGDAALKMRHDETIEWLGMVQRRAAHPNVTPNASDVLQPTIVTSSVVDLSNGATDTNRGW